MVHSSWVPGGVPKKSSSIASPSNNNKVDHESACGNCFSYRWEGRTLAFPLIALSAKGLPLLQVEHHFSLTQSTKRQITRDAWDARVAFSKPAGELILQYLERRIPLPAVPSVAIRTLVVLLEQCTDVILLMKSALVEL